VANIESSPVCGTSCLGELIYGIINRLSLCRNCPKPVTIQYSLTGVVLCISLDLHIYCLVISHGCAVCVPCIEFFVNVNAGEFLVVFFHAIMNDRMNERLNEFKN